jgi:hypothetical protein
MKKIQRLLIDVVGLVAPFGASKPRHVASVAPGSESS